MKVFRHKEHTVYQIRKRLVFIKQHKNKVKFWCKKGFIPNHRFIVRRHGKFAQWHWLIRLPFFYFSKDSGGWKSGGNNFYLWKIR